MKSKLLNLSAIAFVLFLSILACSTPTSEPIPDLTVIQTNAAETVEAHLIDLAANPTPTNASIVLSTSIPPTKIPPPTNTPFPTATTIPTKIVIPCNWMQFIADVTVSDQTTLAANTQFTKIWRLKNVGSCTWSKDYDLVFHSGDKLGGNSLIALPKSVAPGDTVDISVDLTAPNKAGDYLGYWMLRSSNGSKFGFGNDADNPFWVEINVVKPNSAYRYDFAANICEAAWREGESKIPCQGTSAANLTTVSLTDSPRFENGNRENELTLVMNIAEDEKLVGVYPDFTIKSGDRFVAGVGCLYQSEKCKVNFVLSYRVVGTSDIVILKTWSQKYDGKITKINLDLSALDGKTVEFILSTKSLAATDDNQAFWFSPGITQ